VVEYALIDGLVVTGNVQAVGRGGIVFARGTNSTEVRIEDNDCPGCVG
jgi:hypothetical protein